MKHTIVYKGFLLLLAVGAVSCNKDLLDSPPYGQSTSADFWRNADDAVSASNALYSFLGDEYTFAHTEQTWDICSDDQWRAGDHPEDQAIEDFSQVLNLNPGRNDVSDLAPGVYFIRIAGPGVGEVRKVLVIR